MRDDVLKALAAWALVHETADEAWKAAVARGGAAGAEGMGAGPDAFTDGLAAMVNAEKERLKASLAAGGVTGPAGPAAPLLEEVRFELGELRGRLEAIEASLDALRRRLDGGA